MEVIFLFFWPTWCLWSISWLDEDDDRWRYQLAFGLFALIQPPSYKQHHNLRHALRFIIDFRRRYWLPLSYSMHHHEHAFCVRDVRLRFLRSGSTNMLFTGMEPYVSLVSCQSCLGLVWFPSSRWVVSCQEAAMAFARYNTRVQISIPVVCPSPHKKNKDKKQRRNNIYYYIHHVKSFTTNLWNGLPPVPCNLQQNPTKLL